MPTSRLTLQAYVDHLGDLVTDVQGDTAVLITNATCDSRDASDIAGGIFIAVPGSKDDGAHYVKEAMTKGAAAVVATTPITVNPGVARVLVKDAYPAAARIAELLYGFPARRLRLLGVTGTNGKTTIAHLLRAILRESGHKTGMVGTVEYDLGEGAPLDADRTTPPPFLLQYLLGEMAGKQVADVVMEVSSHALDQRRPGTAMFAGAVFTNLTGDHLDYHNTMEEYYQAKRRLFFDYLPPNAPAVVNINDRWGARLAAELQAAGRTVVTFGTAPGCEFRIVAPYSTVRGSTFRLEQSGETPFAVESPLIGDFNIFNLAGAVILALRLGIPEADISAAVTACIGARGRLEPLKTKNGITCFVDYAHTDDALKNVLLTLRRLEPSRLLVLFGCGGNRDCGKRQRMGRAAAELADRVYLTSDNPRNEKPEEILAEIRTGIPAGCDCVEIVDRHEAIRRAAADARPGDILLIAGKGHETYQEQNGQKTPFDDLQVLGNAFIELGVL